MRLMDETDATETKLLLDHTHTQISIGAFIQVPTRHLSRPLIIIMGISIYISIHIHICIGDVQRVVFSMYVYNMQVLVPWYPFL